LRFDKSNARKRLSVRASLALMVENHNLMVKPERMLNSVGGGVIR